MLKLPEGMSRNDLEQWVGGGWVLVGGSSLARYSHSEGDSGPHYFTVYDEPDPGADDPKVVDLATVRCHWPACGAINNYPGFASYVARVPRRQWRRTFNDRCISIGMPLRWAAQKMYGKGPVERARSGAHLPTVKSLFFPEYTDVEDAIELITGKKGLSYAVSPHVILGGDHSTVTAFYRGMPVGTVQDYTLIPEPSRRDEAIRISKALKGVLTV